MSKDPETDLTMASLAHMPLRGTIEAARDLAGLGSWGWDERTQEKFWSPRTRAIFGLAEDAVVDRDVFVRLLHPDDIARYQEAWAAAIDPRGDHLYRLVYRIRRASDGAERWVSSRARVEFEGDVPMRVVGAIRDITEEKANVENLRLSERRFEVALGNSHVAVFEQDLDLRYTWIFNPKLGYSISQVIGRTDHDLMEPASAAELGAIKRKAIQTGQSARAEVAAAAPGAPLEWFDLYVEPRRDEAGAIVGVICAATEITEQKRVQERMRESEEKLRFALEAASAGTWEFVPDTGEFVASDRALILYGLAPGAPVTHESLLAAVHPEDRARIIEAMKRTFEASERYAVELRIALPDGSVRWLESRAELRRDVQPLKMVGLVFDITERKLASEQIQLLLHEVNHRAKNLLTLVQGIARQTLRRHPDDFMEAFGARIQALAANQDVLVRHEWKNVEIGALARSQMRPFEDTLGARFAMQGPTLHLSAQAAQTLGMALHELGTNAAKHGSLTRSEGLVQIDWRVSEGADGRKMFSMNWVERGGPLVTAPARKGFGTSVLGDVTKASLGATVMLDFAERGFSWRVECPLENIGGVEWQPVEGEVAAPGMGARGRVLVVEDEPIVALELAHCLREAGFSVIGPSRSAAQALELLDSFGCDAAVLDINLGDETSEPVARELIRLGKPFVTVSGYSRDQRPAIFVGTPAFDKPVRSELLIAELHRRISAPGAACGVDVVH